MTATTTTETDKAVLELLSKVKKQKDEIAAAKKKPAWKTTCTISIASEDVHDRINIMTVRDTKVLVDICSFLLNKQRLWAEASSVLSLDAPDTYMGFSFADWISDLKTRAGQLELDNKKAKIEALDKRINKLVTAEQRRELELVAIQKEMAEDEV